MSTPLEGSRRAARIALRLQRRTQYHLSTSYRKSGAESSAAAKIVRREACSVERKEDSTPHAPRCTPHDRLSWADMPDDLWPSDCWVVGADLDPSVWPDLWMFLTEGGG